ncbi:MAG TPA: hypothetical protein VNO51_07245 [Ilumatobacteraceae bacterium]|nr:hypothetical protein [Ilumatobacteraceae bacterium]
MTTTGVAGGSWRADVTPWGAIEPWDGSPRLDWFVAADDRWHVPSREPAVRQQRLSGTAVVETRVRIPTGDAVQRVYSVADAGGLTVVEVENDSTLPIAIAFSGRDGVLTDRPVVAVPIEGIELPPSAFVLPVGHRATTLVAIAHEPSRIARLPAGLPSAAQVVGGWRLITSTASRLELPAADRGEALADAVTAARCELVLGAHPSPAEDPGAFAVAIGELHRIGGMSSVDDGDVVADLAEAVAAFAPSAGWRSDAALDAARRVLAGVGESRAAGDVARIINGRERTPRPAMPPDGVWCIPWIEEGLIRHGALLPYGLPTGWLGANFEVFGLPIGPQSRIDYALRWHGERPAVLWDVTGEPVELTAPLLDPGWRTTAIKGEALWPAPATSFS